MSSERTQALHGGIMAAAPKTDSDLPVRLFVPIDAGLLVAVCQRARESNKALGLVVAELVVAGLRVADSAEASDDADCPSMLLEALDGRR